MEGAVRAKEMEIRDRDMRVLIYNLFGINVRFASNPSKFKKKKNPDLSPVTNRELVITMDYPEQDQWDNMIFYFMYPSAQPAQYHGFRKFMDWACYLNPITAGPVGIKSNGTAQRWYDELNDFFERA